MIEYRRVNISEVSNKLCEVIKKYKIEPYYVKCTKEELTKVLSVEPDMLYPFNRMMWFWRNELKLDKERIYFKIDDPNAQEGTLIKNFNFADDYTNETLLKHEWAVKLYDFIEEDIKEYITPFTLRYNEEAIGGILLHPGAVRRAFLSGLPDTTIIKLLICDRGDREEKKVISAFKEKAIPLSNKNPEEINEILEITTKYDPNAETGIRVYEGEKLIEIFQSFPEMTKKKKYCIKYSKEHVIVEDKIVAYFKKPGILKKYPVKNPWTWVINTGENSI